MSASCNGGSKAGNPQVTLIIDDRGSGPNGENINIIKTITQVGGSDEVRFNPGDNNYYTASSSHTSTNLVGGPADPVLGIIEAGWGAEGPLDSERTDRCRVTLGRCGFRSAM